ncbi:MAG: 30S ribosomal protein S21 [Anaerolineales bacterium]|jgi:small subunit ribosomal protein S21
MRVKVVSRRIEIILEKEVKRLVKVVRRNNESTHQLMRRFRKAVARSGKMSAIRKKRWFVSDSEERRMAKKKAIRRQRRQTAKRRRKGRRY